MYTLYCDSRQGAVSTFILMQIELRAFFICL